MRRLPYTASRRTTSRSARYVRASNGLDMATCYRGRMQSISGPWMELADYLVQTVDLSHDTGVLLAVQRTGRSEAARAPDTQGCGRRSRSSGTSSSQPCIQLGEELNSRITIAAELSARTMRIGRDAPSAVEGSRAGWAPRQWGEAARDRCARGSAVGYRHRARRGRQGYMPMSGSAPVAAGRSRGRGAPRRSPAGLPAGATGPGGRTSTWRRAAPSREVGRLARGPLWRIPLRGVSRGPQRRGGGGEIAQRAPLRTGTAEPRAAARFPAGRGHPRWRHAGRRSGAASIERRVGGARGRRLVGGDRWGVAMTT
jgi:hypothetical protein